MELVPGFLWKGQRLQGYRFYFRKISVAGFTSRQ
jgi:hypothetical protein